MFTFTTKNYRLLNINLNGCSFRDGLFMTKNIEEANMIRNSVYYNNGITEIIEQEKEDLTIYNASELKDMIVKLGGKISNGNKTKKVLIAKIEELRGC